MNEVDLSFVVKNEEERGMLIEQASRISQNAEKKKWISEKNNRAESKRKSPENG